MTDVFPSMLAAAGAQPDPAWHVDGANVLDVWRGKTKAPERTLFWEWRSEGSFQLAAMRGNMKVVIPTKEIFDRVSTNKNALAELYDVVRDPAERRTLAMSKTNIAHSLQNELISWIKAP